MKRVALSRVRTRMRLDEAEEFSPLNGIRAVFASNLSSKARMRAIVTIRHWSRRSPYPFVGNDRARWMMGVRDVRTVEKANRELEGVGIVTAVDRNGRTIRKIEAVMDLPRQGPPPKERQAMVVTQPDGEGGRFDLLEAIDAVLRSRFDLDAKLVLLAVVDEHRPHARVPNPQREILAWKTGLSAASVKRAIRRIKENGVVPVAVRAGVPCEFQIEAVLELEPAPEAEGTAKSEGTREPGSSVQKLGSPMHTERVPASTPVEGGPGSSVHGVGSPVQRPGSSVQETRVSYGGGIRDLKKASEEGVEAGGAAARALHECTSVSERTVSDFFGLEAEGDNDTTAHKGRRSARDVDSEIAAARGDYNRRVALQRANDPAWCAQPTPEWLATLYLARTKLVFGDEAFAEAQEEVARSWQPVLAAAAQRLADLGGSGQLAHEFMVWFFNKQAKRRLKPGYQRPGWGLVLNHLPVLDEYRNVLRGRRRSA